MYYLLTWSLTTIYHNMHKEVNLCLLTSSIVNSFFFQLTLLLKIIYTNTIHPPCYKFQISCLSLIHITQFFFRQTKYKIIKILQSKENQNEKGSFFLLPLFINLVKRSVKFKFSVGIGEKLVQRLRIIRYKHCFVNF